jgi:flagellar basal-body rod protein FlgB
MKQRPDCRDLRHWIHLNASHTAPSSETKKSMVRCGTRPAKNEGMDTINVLKQLLDGSAMRHRALANNIANAETQGYRRRDVSFIAELKSAIESANPESITAVKPELKASRKSEGIQLEKEFAALSENHLLYQTSADLLSRKYAGLRKAISGKI